jgi:asparagine synthase (glutamine-hydrolysing)
MIDAYGVLRGGGRTVSGGDLHGRAALEDPAMYVDDGVAVGLGGDEPVEPPRGDDTVSVWVLGEVFGFDAAAVGGAGGYAPKPADVDAGRYCAALYEEYGESFLAGLNGSYTLLVYDPADRELSLCTDRLGTVPVYYARPDDETLVFSSSIQDLPRHPDVETSFHPGYLHEYLAFRHTFGVKTPLAGIETLQPGAVTTFDLVDGSVSTTGYWRPEFRPRAEPFEWFVEEFADRFSRVLSEWTADGADQGVLLSGGSDSRLVLAGLDDATAFHMNEWMNREARTAERSAHAAGAEFVMLRRDPDYRVDALERNREALNFVGWFTQAYTTGLEAELVDRADRLLTGLYGDTLFKRFGVPSRDVSLGPVGSLTLPVERRIESVDDYVDHLLSRAHDGFDLPTDLREVLEANVHRTDDGIVHHGVTYPSLDELAYYDSCYPLSNDNDMLFYSVLRRRLPSRTPFLDDRLLDLSLSLPVRYRLRRNVIDRALDRLSPALSAIPHARTGVPPARSFPVKYVGEHARAFWRKHVAEETPPAPFMTHGSWPDDAELLRANDCFRDVFEARRSTVEGLPGLEYADVREQVRAHLDDDDRLVELYTLLSVLSMPVTDDVLRTDRRDLGPGVEADPEGAVARVPTAGYGEVTDGGRRR